MSKWRKGQLTPHFSSDRPRLSTQVYIVQFYSLYIIHLLITEIVDYVNSTRFILLYLPIIRTWDVQRSHVRNTSKLFCIGAFLNVCLFCCNSKSCQQQRRKVRCSIVQHKWNIQPYNLSVGYHLWQSTSHHCFISDE